MKLYIAFSLRIISFLLHTDMSSLTLDDIDSVSEVGAGGGHLGHHHGNHMGGPMPGGGQMPGPPAWASHFTANPYGPSSYLPPPPPPPPHNYAPPGGAAYNFMNDSASYVSMPGNAADSMHSGSGEGGDG